MISTVYIIEGMLQEAKDDKTTTSSGPTATERLTNPYPQPKRKAGPWPPHRANPDHYGSLNQM